MFQKLKTKIDNYFTDKARQVFEEKKAENKGKTAFAPSSSFSDISSEEAAELLKLSFQRTPSDSFKVIRNGKSVAMDSALGCNMTKQYGLQGIGQNIIYTFFAKHGFIGWQLCALLSQHWLIHRACTIPNQDAMAPGWDNIFEKERPEDTKEQDQKILSDLYQKSEQKYHLTKKCCEFGNNRKIFGISIAFPVIEGVDPSLPFNIDAVKPGSYKGISIVEPYWALPSWTESAMSEPGNLNFYQPEYYSFPYNGTIKKVHRSNLIISTHGQVPDILKPSYYFGGIPLPQMVYERVYAAEKVANEAPLLALTKRLLVADANLEQLYTDPETSKNKIDRLVKMRDNFGVWCKQPGDQFTQIDTSLTDFDQLIMTQYQIVAGIVDIPMFKLMGSNFKGMNPTGEGELKNYVQTLQSLQENVFKPLIERHNLLSMKSDFGQSDMVSAKFHPVDMPTEKELAEVEALKAQTDTAYVNSGILSPEEVRAKVAADKSNSYNSLSEEMPADLDLEEGDFHESDLPKEIFVEK